MNCSRLGSYIRVPIDKFIEVLFHDSSKESLTLRISDKATAFFGIMTLTGSLSTIGWSIKYGIDASVDYAAYSILQDPSLAVSIGTTYVATMAKVSLCASVAGLFLFGVSAIMQEYLHKSVLKPLSEVSN